MLAINAINEILIRTGTHQSVYLPVKYNILQLSAATMLQNSRNENPISFQCSFVDLFFIVFVSFIHKCKQKNLSEERFSVNLMLII